MYKLARAIIKLYLKMFYNVEYINREVIPKDGGYIFCANHVSAIDPFFLACAIKKECAFIAKAELFDNAFIRLVSKPFNIYPIKRGTGDIGAMRKAISLINDGEILVMFPEGTRSKDGKLLEGKSGVTLIAKKTGCRIVPCAIDKKPHIFKKTKVIFGEPYNVNETKTSEELNCETKRLMEKISCLLEEINENNTCC